MPCDIVGPRSEGAEIHLPFWPAVVDRYEITDDVLPGRILTWDPPQSFSWRRDTDTRISELEPSDTGTRLSFTTRVVNTSAGVDQTGAGHHVCLDQLARLLDRAIAGRVANRAPAGAQKRSHRLRNSSTAVSRSAPNWREAIT